MPIHDWTRAPSGYFHHFHQRWTGAICDALNAGLLPKGIFALVEQYSGAMVPDVLALETEPLQDRDWSGSRGGVAIRHYFPLDGEYEIKIRLQRNSLNIGNEIRGLAINIELEKAQI